MARENGIKFVGIEFHEKPDGSGGFEKRGRSLGDESVAKPVRHGRVQKPQAPGAALPPRWPLLEDG